MMKEIAEWQQEARESLCTLPPLQRVRNRYYRTRYKRNNETNIKEEKLFSDSS